MMFRLISNANRDQGETDHDQGECSFVLIFLSLFFESGVVTLVHS